MKLLRRLVGLFIAAGVTFGICKAAAPNGHSDCEVTEFSRTNKRVNASVPVPEGITNTLDFFGIECDYSGECEIETFGAFASPHCIQAIETVSVKFDQSETVSFEIGKVKLIKALIDLINGTKLATAKPTADVSGSMESSGTYRTKLNCKSCKAEGQPEGSFAISVTGSLGLGLETAVAGIGGSITGTISLGVKSKLKLTADGEITLVDVNTNQNCAKITGEITGLGIPISVDESIGDCDTQ